MTGLALMFTARKSLAYSVCYYSKADSGFELEIMGR